jgi:hypothetical protein
MPYIQNIALLTLLAATILITASIENTTGRPEAKDHIRIENSTHSISTDYIAIITVAIAAVSAIAAIVTFYYQRKQFQVSALIEVFRLLNDDKHRHAESFIIIE